MAVFPFRLCGVSTLLFMDVFGKIKLVKGEMLILTTTSCCLRLLDHHICGRICLSLCKSGQPSRGFASPEGGKSSNHGICDAGGRKH